MATIRSSGLPQRNARNGISRPRPVHITYSVNFARLSMEANVYPAFRVILRHGNGGDLQEARMHRSQFSDTREDLVPHSPGDKTSLEPSRREFLAGLGGTAVVSALSTGRAFAQAPESAVNVARVAIPTSMTITSENKISALNDGFTPANSLDRSHALYALRVDPSSGSRTSWVQYDWSEPVNVNKVEIYWAVDRPRPGALPGSAWPRIAAPESYRVLYWNGSDFVPVSQAQGLGVALDTFNLTYLRTRENQQAAARGGSSTGPAGGNSRVEGCQLRSHSVASAGGGCRRGPFGGERRQDLSLGKGHVARGFKPTTGRAGSRLPDRARSFLPTRLPR